MSPPFLFCAFWISVAFSANQQKHHELSLCFGGKKRQRTQSWCQKLVQVTKAVQSEGYCWITWIIIDKLFLEWTDLSKYSFIQHANVNKRTHVLQTQDFAKHTLSSSVLPSQPPSNLALATISCCLKSGMRLILGSSLSLYLGHPNWKNLRLATLVLDIHLMSFFMHTNQSFLDHLATLIGLLPSKGWFCSAQHLSHLLLIHTLKHL